MSLHVSVTRYISILVVERERERKISLFFVDLLGMTSLRSAAANRSGILLKILRSSRVPLSSQD